MTTNKYTTTIALLLSIGLLLSCKPDAESTVSSEATSGAEDTGGTVIANEDQRLLQFLDEVFERNVSQSPEFQAQLGRRTADYGKWDDYSEAWAVQLNDQAEADLARLHAEFDYAALSESARVSYRTFEYDQQQALRNFPWRHHRYAVSQMDNIAADIPTFLQNLHQVSNRADAEAYIERLAGVERVLGQYVERLRQGEAKEVIPPMMVYPRALPAAQNMLKGAPFEEAAEDGVLLADFRAKLEALDLDEEEQAILLNDAANALSGPFRTGYAALVAELTRLQALANDNNGVWDLPDGAAYYANQVRNYTTVPRTADELHELGLAEVARIRGEMEQVMAAVSFEGDLQAFFEYVRTEPENYYPDTDAGRQEYLDEASALIEQVYSIADDWFKLLPKAPLEVRRVEPWREDGSSTAFYNAPAPDGSRPGIYYVNLQDMGAVQKHIMNSLAYHEGAPGHHFQIAIQQELTGIPEYRKFRFYGVYVEGWALYTEQLAFEAGLYEGLPMRNFGRLSEEMKRAVRLVVDTGMHAKRWSREQCIGYMTTNTPMAPDDIERQIERYFVVPGQALSYKVGMLTLLELREKARAALGADFDIREFHDVVLRNGAMPLEILQAVVDDYITAATQQAGAG